jgi:hypothetical protein
MLYGHGSKTTIESRSAHDEDGRGTRGAEREPRADREESALEHRQGRETFTVVQLPPSVVDPELGRRKAQTRKPYSRHVA